MGLGLSLSVGPLALYWGGAAVGPPWDHPELSHGPKNAQDVSQKSLRERFGGHLRRSCALLRPVALHKSVSGAILTPKWVQNGLQNLSKMVRETASEFDIVFKCIFQRFFKKCV